MIALRFSCGSGLAGAAVRVATWSWAAHVGFLLADGRVLDATPGPGVSVRHADDSGEVRYFRVGLPQPALQAALRYAAGQLGQPYDWRGALGIGFRRDWRTEGAWFCSELVAAAFERARAPLIATGFLARVTPLDLLLSPYLAEVRL